MCSWAQEQVWRLALDCSSWSVEWRTGQQNVRDKCQTSRLSFLQSNTRHINTYHNRYLPLILTQQQTEGRSPSCSGTGAWREPERPSVRVGRPCLRVGVACHCGMDCLGNNRWGEGWVWRDPLLTWSDGLLPPSVPHTHVQTFRNVNFRSNEKWLCQSSCFYTMFSSHWRHFAIRGSAWGGEIKRCNNLATFSASLALP